MKTQMLFVFGVLFAILLVGIRSEDEDDWSAEEESCVNELKLNKDDIKTMNDQEIVPEDNSDFNTFLSCYWKKKNIQKDDGNIDFTVAYGEFLTEYRKQVGKDLDIPAIIVGGMVKTAIADCQKESIVGSTHGATAAKTQNCVIKKIKTAVAEIESSEKR